jgi:CheY-like chemotaxis protein
MSDDTNMMRILAVDDHPMFLEALAGLPGSQPDMRVVAAAASGREAIQQFLTHLLEATNQRPSSKMLESGASTIFSKIANLSVTPYFKGIS